MAKANSTIAPKVWEHKGSGKWCLTRKGKRYYLGVTESEAVKRYNRYRQLIDRGLTIPKLGEDPPIGESVEPTVKNLCLTFLAAQELRVQGKDLSQRSLNDYAKTCRDFTEFIGDGLWFSELNSDHFAQYKADVSKRRNLVSVGNEVTRVKTIFKWLLDDEKIDRLPNFGKHFARPKKSAVRLYKHNKGRTTFTREECLLLLSELGVHERAMALLGINGAFGNSDASELLLRDVNLEGGYIKNLRSKTKELRFVTLWPETLAALKLSLQFRHNPVDKDAEDRFFVTFDGRAYVQESTGKSKATNDLLGSRVRGALQRLKMYSPGMTFYRLRATFRTVANGCRDDRAAAVIMGHVRDGMADEYIDIRHIEDDANNRARIQAVTDHVRGWLFGSEAE